jgi:hypothetical protein
MRVLRLRPRPRPSREPGRRRRAIDVALASALDLEHAARPQRLGQPRPEAIVVGDPVRRRRRDDRVDRLVQIEVEHVLAPHLRAVAESPARKRHHVRRGVHGEDTAPHFLVACPLN